MALRPLTCLCAVLTFALVDLAAQNADFSGRWKVNHGAGNPPSQSNSEQIWDISQSPTEVRLRLLVNGREVSVHSWLLGGPALSARRDGFDSITTAMLNPGGLIISGKAVAPTGVEVAVQEEWSIDPTTRALRVAKTNSTGATTLTRVVVLERVEQR